MKLYRPYRTLSFQRSWAEVHQKSDFFPSSQITCNPSLLLLSGRYWLLRTRLPLLLC